MKLAAAYVRVSDERQDEYSPDSQLNLIKAYAKRNDYMIVPEYIYYDDGISAKSTKGRTQFNRMIAAAESREHPFDAIIVWKFSRFARNTEDSILLKARLRRKGVSVLSVSENVEESGEFGELIERIIEWDDAHYLTRLSQEVKRGMLEKASRGEPMSRQFGYDLKNKQLIPNEDAKIVQSVFEDYAAGVGMRAIAQRLNAQGFRTKRGNPADNRFIEYMLRNPVYIGKIRWSKEGKSASKRNYGNQNVLIFDGLHEPIIDMETWNKVQAIMDETKRKYPRYQRPEQTVDFMLKGLIHCDTCGATLCLNRKSSPQFLQCHNYSRGQCTVSHAITLKKANESVIAALNSAIMKLDFSIIPQYEQQHTGNKINYDKLIRAEENKLEKAKDAYLAGIDTIEEYKDNKRRITEQIETLRQQKSDCEKPDPEFDPAEYAEKVKSVLDVLSGDASECAKNEVLRTIVHKIVYEKPSQSLRLFFYR